MRHLLLVLACIAASLSFAQTAEEVKNYTWSEIPNFPEVPAEFETYPAVVLKDYRLCENKVSGYAYKAFIVRHQAIKILKSEGINDYNKVIIDKKYVRDYRDLKVRVIKSNGKIEELPKEKIIEKSNSDEKQFVFEGVEAGDIIEYYYVIKDFPEFSGTEYFQRAIPVMDGKFQINRINLGGTYMAVYNGVQKAMVNDKYVCTVTNLPAYKFEPNAANYANAAKLYFYVDADFNYNFKSFYNSLNNFADGVSAKSMVRSFIQEQKLDDTSIPLDQRLQQMDTYLKENVALDNQQFYKKVFDTKKISPRMVLYLYKDVLDYLRVPYQFIASTDKFYDHFDQNMVVPATLSEILIYIPETKKYLSPFYYWMPYGPPNSVCIDNQGVFFTKERNRVDYKFEQIGGVSMKDNVNITNSTISIGDDMETVLVNKKSSFTGYRSYYYRDVIKKIEEDKIKDFVKDVVFNESDVELKSFSFNNKEYKFNYDDDKPFTFETSVQVKESWIENAGKNYLITVGKVLGMQSNLYQENETRVNPIVTNYPKKYLHTITLTVPAGYTVGNLNSVTLNKELKNENNEIIGKFASTAKVTGGILTISIEEFYNFTQLGKERYKEYRDLINASYDFYKSSLVLTKA